MSKVFNVSYDLNSPGQQYTKLYDELKRSPAWWHHLTSTWLIYTGETASQLFDRIRPHIDQNDHVLITEVGPDYSGWLPEKAWQWIKDQLATARR